MIKRTIVFIPLTVILLVACSCALLTKPLEKRTGFSNHLQQLETHIRIEEWDKAKTSYEESKIAWERIKPMMQIDIDHDYVKDIEDNLTRLNGYIETKEKPDSLVTILLIKDTWKNIGTL